MAETVNLMLFMSTQNNHPDPLAVPTTRLPPKPPAASGGRQPPLMSVDCAAEASSEEFLHFETRWRWLAGVLGVSVLYVVTAKLGFLFGDPSRKHYRSLASVGDRAGGIVNRGQSSVAGHLAGLILGEHFGFQRLRGRPCGLCGGGLDRCRIGVAGGSGCRRVAVVDWRQRSTWPRGACVSICARRDGNVRY